MRGGLPFDNSLPFAGAHDDIKVAGEQESTIIALRDERLKTSIINLIRTEPLLSDTIACLFIPTGVKVGLEACDRIWWRAEQSARAPYRAPAFSHNGRYRRDLYPIYSPCAYHKSRQFLKYAPSCDFTPHLDPTSSDR